jgi:hypothetical protein
LRKQWFCISALLGATTLAAATALAKERQTVVIEVVSAQTAHREWSYNLSGSLYGGDTAPSKVTGTTTEENVYAIYNGTHITRWCQACFRHCHQPSPGTYKAEIRGNTVWLYGYELDGVTVRKTTYRYTGGW